MDTGLDHVDHERLPFDTAVHALRAVAEPSRVRILAALSHIELTVGELCTVLGQTQPRVSRHLKLLVDAGLLERRSEGTFAFYRPSSQPTIRRLHDVVLSSIDRDGPAFARDHERLDQVRSNRAAAAAEYFEHIAAEWDRVRDLHVADDEVEIALLAAVDGQRTNDLLDVGTGTGRILELFAGRIRRGLGIDLSVEMLNVARSQLDRDGFDHCSIRQGNAYDLDIHDGSMDVAVMHHVLHFLDDPARAVAESARTLRPGGSLLIVDFAPHGREEFRSDYQHRFLGFTDADVRGWCEASGLVDIDIAHLRKQNQNSEDLTITLWVARQNAAAHEYYELETA